VAPLDSVEIMDRVPDEEECDLDDKYEMASFASAQTYAYDQATAAIRAAASRLAALPGKESDHAGD